MTSRLRFGAVLGPPTVGENPTPARHLAQREVPHVQGHRAADEAPFQRAREARAELTVRAHGAHDAAAARHHAG
jgi:hypothetical protein